jgi:plasmid replication initiation protein
MLHLVGIPDGAVGDSANHLPIARCLCRHDLVLTPLLPERHPVRDFFVLDTIDMVPRSDMATMEHPIYSLATVPERRRLSYENGDVRVEIIPSSIGLPTVFDKDIVIYCISKLMQAKNKGLAIGQEVRLTTHDLLVETNRPTNNLGYERLLPALNRLRGVVINTTITTGAARTTHGFGLIDAFEYNRKGSMHSERLRYLDIKLSDWVYRAIASSEVLPISRDYFRLRAPVDRRIYEIVRKHCGKQASWRVGLELLQKKVGSKQADKHFHAHLRNLVRSNHLPDYAVTVEDGQAVFYKRPGNDAGDGMPADRRAVTPSRRTDDRTDAGQLHGDGDRVPRMVRVSGDAFERAREIAPGWDVYALENLYINWASEKDAARNEDARFLGWVRSYTKGKRAG